MLLLKVSIPFVSPLSFSKMSLNKLPAVRYVVLENTPVRPEHDCESFQTVHRHPPRHSKYPLRKRRQRITYEDQLVWINSTSPPVDPRTNKSLSKNVQEETDDVIIVESTEEGENYILPQDQTGSHSAEKEDSLSDVSVIEIVSLESSDSIVASTPDAHSFSAIAEDDCDSVADSNSDILFRKVKNKERYDRRKKRKKIMRRLAGKKNAAGRRLSHRIKHHRH